MPDAGCPMPDARCPMPDARCQMPDARCRMPVASCRIPDAGCQIFKSRNRDQGLQCPDQLFKEHDEAFFGFGGGFQDIHDISFGKVVGIAFVSDH